MSRLHILTALFLPMTVCMARATPPVTEAPAQQSEHVRCTSTPCGNTASGKDPQEENIEAGRKMQDALRAGDDDRKRWVLPIYSTSERPESLSLDVVRSAGLALRLAPAQGHLTISTPDAKHVFAIAGTQGAGTVCPKYNLYVTDASNDHILLKRVCRSFEYEPGRFAKSVTYYLYDRPTGTMRDIWTARASGEDDPVPDAKPRPALKRIPNGYQFDWSGTYSGEAGGQRREIHNRFTRKLDGGQRTLICTNVSTGSGRGDASACEGEYLQRVSD